MNFPIIARAALASLLEGYETFCDFDRRELGLIEALREARPELKFLVSVT